MKEARFYTTIDGVVHCALCPHRCRIADGRKGVCQVRKAEGGHLYSLSYGVVSALALDPIEKKPLYHFHPGKKILSVGSVGCNFKCPFCQNHSISQVRGMGLSEMLPMLTPSQVLAKALELVPDGNIGVAFTYSEPSVWFEFVTDTASRIKESGLHTAMISNGFIEQIPLDELLGVIDAFNIDLKGYSNTFYKRMLGGDIEPVKRTLKAIVRSGKHLEITYLVIPNENDSIARFREVVMWISEVLDPKIVLHINRYFPQYLMSTPPTSLETLISLYSVAKEYLQNVYIGNTSLVEHSNTYCTKCGKLLVERGRMSGRVVGLTNDGRCSSCLYKAI